MYELSATSLMPVSKIRALTPMSEKSTTPLAGIVRSILWKVPVGPEYLVKGANSVVVVFGCPLGPVDEALSPPPPHPEKEATKSSATARRR